jgi:hypothetical protein
VEAHWLAEALERALGPAPPRRARAPGPSLAVGGAGLAAVAQSGAELDLSAGDEEDELTEELE